MQNTNKGMSALLPKIAKKVGVKTTENACIWWIYQPKVPAAMQKTKK